MIMDGEAIATLLRKPTGFFCQGDSGVGERGTTAATMTGETMKAVSRQVLHRVVRHLLGLRCHVPAHARVIFAYHDVSAASAPHHSPHYSTDPDTFERHLDLLQRHFSLVGLDDIVSTEGNGSPTGRPRAALTFDDGFASVLHTVRPILARRGVPFALFLNRRAVLENHLHYQAPFGAPAVPAGTRVYLDGDQVAELARAGILVGSHGTDHQPLAGRSADELQARIGDNKAYLEGLLGQPVRHFALPYGKKEFYDRRTLAFCYAAGHSHVYTTNPTLFSAADLRPQTPVPRIGVTNESDSDLLFLLNRPLLRRLDL
jgi:peptidoglycan/xylan/chitin deacetylase (PgdA/CDA1 family)